RWDFAVRVPIVRDGEVTYILSAVVNPVTISKLLKAQHLPSDWVGVVIDGNQRIVARTQNPEESVAQLASQSLRDALRRAPSGWFHGSTIEGTQVYTPYRRSQTTGWTFAMGIPAYVVDRAGQRARILLGIGLLTAVALALVLALLVGRRIAQPITALADATKAMGHGQPFKLPEHDAPVSEVRTLSAALHEAALAINERQSLIQREKTALQAADRSKDEFLAMLSHELRTPLAALTTAAHVLRVAGADQHRAAQARGVVERQTRHMARLLEDLLDVSRISLGKAHLQRESFDLGELVEQLVAGWRASGRFEHHRFAHATVPVWLLADRTRIEQVISNLLDNALKFTPRGRSVSLTLRQAGTEALLQVADEGMGLSGEAMNRVFDPFVQGEQGLDPHKSGMGIGLALVKQLTEMHGGSVSVASQGPGTGTVFTVRLPAMLSPHTQLAARAASGEGSGARHVLIIEDNEDTRTMLREALALIGHEVREAADGAAGLAAARAAPPDIALIDIGLPDMDGYEVARRLRENSPNGHMPLIALSGYGQPSDVKRAYDAGFDVHLTKPVDIEELHGAIRAFR
ncbi:MAG TPA: ATP-binding protein, partial [Burkholderiales bacterium]|nr:ATP-binding protein [Burkholderiales bacterium]